MIKNLIKTDIYVKVYENKFEAKNLSMNRLWEQATPEQPFSTERLLVGTFSTAEPALTELIKRLTPSGLLKRRPHIVIQPMGKTEGGISEVEARTFKELAYGAGGFKVIVHVGKELSDVEAVKLLRNL